MKRESLVRIRTLRDTSSSMDRSRFGPKPHGGILRPRPMQGVRESTPEEQEHIAQVLHLEEARFRRRLAKVEVGRRKMLAVRSNLGRLHRKNAQLMELRCRLQREQWAKENPQSEELQKGRNRTPPRS